MFDTDPRSNDSEAATSALELLQRAGRGASDVGNDPARARVLEVSQAWGDTVLDTRHYRLGHSEPIRLGTRTGYRWHLLGVDMGRVSPTLAAVLPFAPPLASEIRSVNVDDFALSGTEHELVVWEDDRFVADVPRGWELLAEVGGARLDGEQLVEQGRATVSGDSLRIPIDDDLRLLLDSGDSVFLVHTVPASRHVPSRLFDHLDGLFLAILALAAFIGLMFAIAVVALPTPPRIGVVDVSSLPTVIIAQREVKRPKVEPTEPDHHGPGSKGSSAAPNERPAPGKGRRTDREIVAGNPLLLAMGGIADGAISTDLAANVGIIGSKGPGGPGGLNAFGGAIDGGGSAEAWGRPGGTGGRPGGAGCEGCGEFGPGRGEPELALKKEVTVLGSLHPWEVDEVIKNHLSQIRYCYSRELQRNPGLAGKVVTRFVISKTGDVSKASTGTTTLNNAAVEQCIEGRVMRMKFPQPRGNGIVLVSYPFLFDAAR